MATGGSPCVGPSSQPGSEQWQPARSPRVSDPGTGSATAATTGWTVQTVRSTSTSPGQSRSVSSGPSRAAPTSLTRSTTPARELGGSVQLLLDGGPLGGDHEPRTGDALALEVADLIIADVVVQRLIVVGDLQTAVLGRDRADQFLSDLAVDGRGLLGREHRPALHAAPRAGAFPVRILGEDVERASLAIHHVRPERRPTARHLRVRQRLTLEHVRLLLLPGLTSIRFGLAGLVRIGLLDVITARRAFELVVTWGIAFRRSARRQQQARQQQRWEPTTQAGHHDPRLGGLGGRRSHGSSSRDRAQHVPGEPPRGRRDIVTAGCHAGCRCRCRASRPMGRGSDRRIGRHATGSRRPNAAPGSSGDGVLLRGALLVGLLHAPLEAVDPSTGVHELLLARVEGVALVAQLDADAVDGRPRFERVPTGARDGRERVLGVDVLLHCILRAVVAPRGGGERARVQATGTRTPDAVAPASPARGPEVADTVPREGTPSGAPCAEGTRGLTIVTAGH